MGLTIVKCKLQNLKLLILQITYLDTRQVEIWAKGKFKVVTKFMILASTRQDLKARRSKLSIYSTSQF
jgi:hypothetical protein